MIVINTTANNISMNGIELATKRESIDSDILNSKEYFLEFNPKYELITISTRFIHNFSVNGKIVNFDNISDFLIKNNALVDGPCIIIPNYSISLHINLDEKIFLEVLIYSPLVQNLYKKEHLKKYEYCIDNKSLMPSEIVFTPYQSVGKYNFGESEEYFLNQTKLSYHEDRGVNNKKYYDYQDTIFRFDHDKLSQIQICNPDIKIIFNQININTIDGINSLLSQYSVIKSRSHNILLDIGVAVKSKIETRADIELYFFDRYLVKYWQNIYRPITSW